MSKGVIGVIAVCLFLGLAGAAVLGWLYLNRDRAAVASYRVQLPEGVMMTSLIDKEAELMQSEAVLQPVVEVLELKKRWKLDSDDAALERLRSKLKVKPGSEEDRVKVVYRDRSQKRALEILREINRQFGQARAQATEDGILPPVAPLKGAPTRGEGAPVLP